MTSAQFDPAMLDAAFARAGSIADAVLYEGYVLYPYRASAAKNRVRWQFGVVAPAAYVEATGDESASQRTEVVVARHAVERSPAGVAALAPPPDDVDGPVVHVRVRFLHAQDRVVERATSSGWAPVDAAVVDGRRFVTWQEAVPRSVDAPPVVIGQGRDPVVTEVTVDGGRDVEQVVDDVRLVRRRWPVTVRITASARPATSAHVVTSARPAAGGLTIVRVDVANATDLPAAVAAERTDAVRRALLGCHTLLAVRGGRAISPTDPAPEAADAVAACDTVGVWPVLVDEAATVVLSSPIILPDHPQIAPESPGDLYDGTEIDELLTLRIQTMTDDEQDEARATDDRARAVIDRSLDMPPAVLEGLHGTVRRLRPRGNAPTTEPVDPFATDTPWWAPEADVDPADASVAIGGRTVGRGDRVRLAPGPRGDTMDRFVRGRTATIVSVHTSVDDDVFVAVLLDDDPARPLHDHAGRYLYYRPDELVPHDGEPDGGEHDDGADDNGGSA